MKRPLLAAALAGSAFASLAAPMGFKGSQMVMADFGQHWREAHVNHAFTARDAVGVGAMWMRADDRSHERSALELTYTRLVKRWNLPDAQANVWFIGSAGAVRGSDFDGSRGFVAPGLQLDYETTRIYLAASARFYRAGSVTVPADVVDDGGHGHGEPLPGGAVRLSLDHDVGAVRAGFSFYEAEYDEVQPWFVLEARRVSGLSERTEVTPMLRFISSRWFVEAGINDRRQARLAFMHTF